jgi:hypothetical protein
VESGVKFVDVLGRRQLGDGELAFVRAGLLLQYLCRQQIAKDPGRLVL